MPIHIVWGCLSWFNLHSADLGNPTLMEKFQLILFMCSMQSSETNWILHYHVWAYFFGSKLIKYHLDVSKTHLNISSEAIPSEFIILYVSFKQVSLGSIKRTLQFLLFSLWAHKNGEIIAIKCDLWLMNMFPNDLTIWWSHHSIIADMKF